MSELKRRNTVYDNDIQTFENPPKVVESNTTANALEAEEFEGDYGGRLTGEKKNKPQSGNVFGQFFGVIKKGKGSGVNTTIRELVIYFLYLVVLCFIAFSTANSNAYYFTKVMSDLFTKTKGTTTQRTYTDISCMEDIWDYFEDQLLAGIYWDGDSIGLENPSGNESTMIYYENRLLGHPRIRMLRVTNDSCDVVESFSREIKECFNPYIESKEDRTDMEVVDETVITDEAVYGAFKWTPQKELYTRKVWGGVSTYGGGGYVAYLDLNNRTTSDETIRALRVNRWISRGARAVIVDFSLYNANINMFSIVQLILELPPTGGVIPKSNFESMRIIRYVTTYDKFILVCEAIFTAFVVFFLIEEIIEICKWRLRYFGSFWNIVDVVVISLSITTVILSLNRSRKADKTVGQIIEDGLQMAYLDDAVYAQNIYNNLVAILLFFAWIKIFKYISFNKTMNQLSATLSRSAKDIGGFAVMFFIFFFAYAQFGYLSFGTQIADYSTFYDAVFALLRTILGDFDFHALERANRILGPVYFMTYIFFVFFVLLNMFLAIINDTYVEVKQELESQKSDFEVAEFFKKNFYRTLRFLRLTKNMDSADPTTDYNLWQQQLIERGYTKEEIDESFARFNLDETVKTAESDKKKVEEQLELSQNKDSGEAHKDYIVIYRRLEQIESRIGKVGGEFQSLVNRVESIEGSKVLNKESKNVIAANELANKALPPPGTGEYI